MPNQQPEHIRDETIQQVCGDSMLESWGDCNGNPLNLLYVLFVLTYHVIKRPKLWVFLERIGDSNETIATNGNDNLTVGSI